MEKQPKKKRQPLRIDVTTDATLATIVRTTSRINWRSKGQQKAYEEAIVRNNAREYGVEYLQWILACIALMGPDKGWTLDRAILYLESDERYTGKLEQLKKRRQTGKTHTRTPIDATKDFLAEDQKRHTG